MHTYPAIIIMQFPNEHTVLQEGNEEKHGRLGTVEWALNLESQDLCILVPFNLLRDLGDSFFPFSTPANNESSNVAQGGRVRIKCVSKRENLPCESHIDWPEVVEHGGVSQKYLGNILSIGQWVYSFPRLRDFVVIFRCKRWILISSLWGCDKSK